MITNEMANLELGVHSGRQTQLALVGERGIISGSACKRLKREGEDNRRDEWSTEAVTCLLDVYEAKWNQRSRGNLKGGDWEEVAARVSARGGGHRLPKTPFQCKKKVASMKQKYSSETLLRGLSESAGTCRWPFFERMDVMLRVNATGSGKDDDGDDQQAATPTAGVSCGGGGPQGGGAEEELRHHQPPRDALPVDAAEGRLQAMVASMMRLQEPGDESGDSDSAGDEEEVIGTAEAAGAVVIRGGVHHATTAKTTAGYGGLRQQHHACDEDHPHGHYNHENSVQEDASNTVGPHAGKPGTNESRESTPKSRAPPSVAAAAGARVMKHDHHRISDMQHNMMSASNPRTAAGVAAMNHHEARGGNAYGIPRARSVVSLSLSPRGRRHGRVSHLSLSLSLSLSLARKGDRQPDRQPVSVAGGWR